MTLHLQSDPYPWPYDGDLRAANTALVIIDMQTDFCGIGGGAHTEAHSDRKICVRLDACN